MVQGKGERGAVLHIDIVSYPATAFIPHSTRFSLPVANLLRLVTTRAQQAAIEPKQLECICRGLARHAYLTPLSFTEAVRVLLTSVPGIVNGRLNEQ